MVCPNIWIDFDFNCFALMLRALISCNIVVCPNFQFGWFALICDLDGLPSALGLFKLYPLQYTK